MNATIQAYQHLQNASVSSSQTSHCNNHCSGHARQGMAAKPSHLHKGHILRGATCKAQHHRAGYTRVGGEMSSSGEGGDTPQMTSADGRITDANCGQLTAAEKS